MGSRTSTTGGAAVVDAGPEVGVVTGGAGVFVVPADGACVVQVAEVPLLGHAEPEKILVLRPLDTCFLQKVFVKNELYCYFLFF